MPKIPIFCSLLPAGFFAARGFELAYLTARELAGVQRSEYHCAFHENICSYSKALYEYLLKKEAQFDFIVIPLSCDAMRKLYSALMGRVAREKLIALDFPKNKSDEGIVFFAEQLKRLDTLICKG